MLVSGWEESIIKLISAEAEALTLLGLAELGNTNPIETGCQILKVGVKF